MAYATGSVILDDEYNGFVADVNLIWGAATDSLGWGQSGTLSTVSAGSTITATQWENLASRVEAIANHTNQSGVSYSTVTAGSTIEAIDGLETDIATLKKNRGNLHAHGTDVTGSNSRTASWNDTLTFTATIAFGSDANANEFFNTGGIVGTGLTSLGNGSGDKDTAWGNMVSAMGTVWITGAGANGCNQDSDSGDNVILAGTSYQGTQKTGGSGSATTMADTGFYDLTTSLQETFKQYDSTYTYTTNYVTVQYSYNGSGTLTVRTHLQDDANTGVPGGVQDPDVTLDIRNDITVRQPSTTYISNSWGTPSISFSVSAT